MKDKNPVNVLALIIIAASLLVCSTSEAGNAD